MVSTSIATVQRHDRPRASGWKHRSALNFALGWRDPRVQMAFFAVLALTLLAVLAGLIQQQVERGKTLRMEQVNRLQVLNSCSALVGDERHGCRERAMAVAGRLPDARDAVRAAEPSTAPHVIAASIVR